MNMTMCGKVVRSSIIRHVSISIVTIAGRVIAVRLSKIIYLFMTALGGP